MLWVNQADDISLMHHKFKVNQWVADNPDKLGELLELRMRMLREEFNETNQAVSDHDPEEFVDGLIDLCVIAIGTLDIYGVDVNEAWDKVFNANISKEVGVKPERPNPLGLPDLIKPEGWQAPSHKDNHGSISEAFNQYHGQREVRRAEERAREAVQQEGITYL